MPYTKTTWTSGVTPLSATNMSNLEKQYDESTLSFGPDLFTPGFVLSGYTAAIDGTFANQLDVASGRAYLVQSDGTTRLRANGATTYITTVPLTTYYLFLLVDGTWQWSTTSTGPANSLAIAQATTNAGANISGVTDVRSQNANILPAFSTNGVLTFPGRFNTTMMYRWSHTLSGSNSTILDLTPPDVGAKHYGLNYNADNSLVIHNYTDNTDLMKLTSTGAIATLANQAMAGNLGTPGIVARADGTSVSNNTPATIISFTPASSPSVQTFRLSGWIALTNGGGTSHPTFQVTYRDGLFNNSRTATLHVLPVEASATAGLTALSGSNTIAAASGTGDMYSIVPIDLYHVCSGSVPIVATFTESAVTAGDTVTLVLERLN